MEAAKPKDQETSNLEAYGRIFSKCLGVAQRIVKDAGGGNPTDIAEALFRQFYHDQIELVKQNQLVDYLKGVMNRGRM